MSPTPPALAAHPALRPALARGPLLMALAALVFTVMASLVKTSRAELGAAEIIVWRSLVSVPLAALPLVALAARGAFPWPQNHRALLARLLLGFASMVGVFTAARGLALAEQNLIDKVQPLVVAVAAPALLGADERPEPRTWIALLLGLLGCALLVLPDLRGGDLWALWALAGAVFSAGAHVALRVLGRTDHPALVVFSFQAGLVPLSLLLHLAVSGGAPALPSPALWGPLAGIGLCAFLGQTLMTRAYQLDRAAPVAAAAYTSPLWALLADLVVWHATPGWTTIVGGGVIVAAGMLVVWRR